jgi:NADH-quinone oxidoreductase subunit C
MSEEHLINAVNAIKERFGVSQAEIMKEPTALFVPADKIVEVCRTLHDEFGFNFMSDITASDYWPEMEPRMHAIYNLYSQGENTRITLRVPLNGDHLVLPTIESIYHAANWYERELWDMFGIHFEGHSDMRRILMPEDWVGHPLQKDYPLGYEEPQFTFNYEKIQARKHKARYEEA